MCRIFIGECFWDRHLWKEKKARLSRSWVVILSQGCLSWLGYFLELRRGSWLFYPFRLELTNHRKVATVRRRHDLGRASFLQWGNSQRWLKIERCLLVVFLAAREIRPLFLKGDLDDIAQSPPQVNIICISLVFYTLKSNFGVLLNVWAMVNSKSNKVTLP